MRLIFWSKTYRYRNRKLLGCEWRSKNKCYFLFSRICCAVSGTGGVKIYGPWGGELPLRGGSMRVTAEICGKIDGIGHLERKSEYHRKEV